MLLGKVVGSVISTIKNEELIGMKLLVVEMVNEKLVGSGAFTINDVLKAAGMPTINEPWANKHFLTKNIAEIEEAAAALEA